MSALEWIWGRSLYMAILMLLLSGVFYLSWMIAANLVTMLDFV